MVNLRTVSTRRWLRWTKVHIISVTARTVASKAVNPMASRERPTYMQRPCINCGVMPDGESAWHQRFKGGDFFNGFRTTCNKEIVYAECSPLPFPPATVYWLEGRDEWVTLL